jgi:hypothetical protein
MYAEFEKYHPIPLIAPVDTAAVTLNSDVIDAGEAIAIAFQVHLGVITGDDLVITVEECDDIVPTTQTAIAFKYRKSSAVGTDSLGAVTDSLAAGLTVLAADDNKMIEIYVDPAALTADYPYLRVVVDPGASMSVLLAGITVNILPRKNPPGSFVD